MKSIPKQKLKQIAKLKLKKYRDIEKSLLIEGARSIRQLVDDRVELKELYVLGERRRDYEDIICYIGEDRVYTLQDHEIKKLSSVPSPQGAVALAAKPKVPWKSYDRLLFLDRLSNPVNMGAIFRSAAAFNIQGIILSDGCCDIFNPAAVRSSVGKVMSMPVINESDFRWDKFSGEIIAADLAGEISVYSLEPEESYMIILGSEAKGISEPIKNKAGKTVFIPMANRLESLNVVVAGSLLMFRLNRPTVKAGTKNPRADYAD